MSSEAWMMKPEARRSARREARAASTLRAGGMRATDVEVLDISETGVRITSDVALEIGQEISIGLAGVGARSAYVAWTRDLEYGCAFARPLEEQEAAQAFASPSVVPIGFVQHEPAAPGDRGVQMADLYARHRTFALPWDAVLALTLFLGLAGAAVWMLIRP